MAIAVNKSEIKQRFAESGVETVGSSPEPVAAAMNAEMRASGSGSETWVARNNLARKTAHAQPNSVNTTD